MEKTIRMNNIPESQIQLMGINALKEKLGVVNTLKFLQQFDDGGNGNYTEEKYLEDDIKMTKQEMIEKYM